MYFYAFLSSNLPFRKNIMSLLKLILYLYIYVQTSERRRAFMCICSVNPLILMYIALMFVCVFRLTVEKNWCILSVFIISVLEVNKNSCEYVLQPPLRFRPLINKPVYVGFNQFTNFTVFYSNNPYSLIFWESAWTPLQGPCSLGDLILSWNNNDWRRGEFWRKWYNELLNTQGQIAVAHL